MLHRLSQFSFLKSLYFPFLIPTWASLVAQMVKCLPAVRETQVQFLGREDPLEKEMATHSSILAWRIPWTEEPDRGPRGRKESDTTEQLHSLTHSIPTYPLISNVKTTHWGKVSFLSFMWLCSNSGVISYGPYLHNNFIIFVIYKGLSPALILDISNWESPTPKLLQMMIAAMKLKDAYSLEGKLWPT